MKVNAESIDWQTVQMAALMWPIKTICYAALAAAVRAREACQDLVIDNRKREQAGVLQASYLSRLRGKLTGWKARHRSARLAERVSVPASDH